MGRIRQLFFGLLLTALVGTSCSISSVKEDARESPPPPKREIVGPTEAGATTEVLGVVATPDAESADESPPEPTPQPTPTLTAYRVAVHTTGDWIIDGDEVVTVHSRPAGEPVGAVAVGVLVRSTGSARVLGEVTWLEIELPDGTRGYVRSADLRIGHQDRPSTEGEAATMTGAPPEEEATVAPEPTPVPESAVAPIIIDDPTAAPPTPTPPVVEPTAPAPDTFVLTDWDPQNRTYEVTARTSQLWVLLDEEMVPATSLPAGHRVQVLSAQGRIVADMRLIPIRARGFDGWIESRDLVPLA